MRSKKVAERYRISKQTAMGASDEAANQYDDCINLSLGDPDFTTPEPIIAQAFADARAGHTKYTDFRVTRSCAKRSESSTRKNIRSRFRIKKFL